MTDPTDKNAGPGGDKPQPPTAATPKPPPLITPMPVRGQGLGAVGAFMVSLVAIIAVGAALYVTRDRWMSLLQPARDERVDATISQLQAQVQSQLEAARKQVEEAAQRLAAAAGAKPADIKLNADVVALQDALKALAKEKESLAEWITQLAAKIETMGAGGGAADAKLAQRLEQVETQARTLVTRLGEIDKRMTQLDQLLDVLQKQTARADQYAARMDKIEQDVQGRTGQDARSLDTGRAAGLIAFSFRLRQAIDAGQPLAPTLMAMQPLVAGDAELAEVLKPLQAAADNGVITRAALTAQFARVARMTVAADEPEGDWLSTVWRRMKQIVSVRRVGADVQGDSAEAVVARAEAALNQGRLQDAVAELAKLKGPPAREAAEWLAKAQTRLAAEQACDKLLSEAARRLARAGDKG